MNGFLVHLMRHGIPARPGRLLGQLDEAPLPIGVTRCVAAADRLDFNHVISSDLARALVPARRIASARGASDTVDARWRELDFGAWTGLDPAEVEPGAYGRFWDDPDACPPPEGERWSHLCARVGEAVLHLDQPSLVVTHGGTMRAALAALFHMEHRQVWAFDLPYSCVLSLRLWPDDGMPAAQIVALSA